MEPIIVILIILGVIVVAYLVHRAEQARRKAFRAVAQKLGLSFRMNDYGMDERYRFLGELRKGDDRCATVVLEGNYKQHQVEAFEYVYETYSRDSKGNRQTHYHWSNHYIITETHPQAPLPYPELRVYPETFLSKIGQALGYDDIDFESIEFSKEFTVRSKDKRFAYDILHPRMIEWLLKRKNTVLEIEGACIAISYEGKMHKNSVVQRIDQIIAIREQFPEYLFDGSR